VANSLSLVCNKEGGSRLSYNKTEKAIIKTKSTKLLSVTVRHPPSNSRLLMPKTP
jgi:hypothetical protein